MIELRAPRGLGDAVYLRAVVLHLLALEHKVGVHTLWPAAFADLPVRVGNMEDSLGRPNLRIVAYELGRLNPDNLSNFATACLRAEITEPVELRLGWTVRNHALLERVTRMAAGRPIMLYQPTKSTRNTEQQLMRPARKVYNAFVAAQKQYFRIKLGQPPFVESDAGAPCELDLFGATSIHDMFDLATICDFAFGESCVVPMLAEACDKPFAIMFTRRALDYTGSMQNQRIRNVTPERLFHKKHLGTAVYDES